MTTEVFIVQESVQHEDSGGILGVFEDEEDALDRAREFADEHRYGGHWDWYRNEEDGQVVGSLTMRDVSISVERYVVE